jgi:hypothetical protein
MKFDTKTRGLTDNEEFDNLRIFYISQALLLYGCKAFFIGYFAISFYISRSKKDLSRWDTISQYRDTVILKYCLFEA